MNPIIRRELLEWLRTRKAMVLQLSLGLACALLVLLRWPTGGVGDLSGARSLEVLRVLGDGLLACILLLVPAYPATSIVREKISGTLALLLNSPLSAWSIYIGKLGGVLGFAAILLVMTVPAAAACFALGGTPVQGGVGKLYLVLAVATLELATLGLLVSSLTQTTDGALRLTYALVLALTFLPLGPYALLQGESGLLVDAAAWLRCLSPIPAVMEVLGQADLGTHGLSVAHHAVSRYFMLAIPLSLIFAAITLARLNSRLFDRARPAGVMTHTRSRSARLLRQFFFLVDPQRRSEHISLWTNPVMAKEFRCRRFGRSHWTLRLIALCAIVSLALSCGAASGALGWGVELIGVILVLLQVALLIFFAPSLAAGLISTELENRSWQLLRMTPLSSGVILRGKLLSVAWPLLLILCATLPGYVVMMTIKPQLTQQLGAVIGSIALTGVFTVLLSAVISSLCRSTAVATTASYLVPLVIGLGPLLVWLGRGAPFGHNTVETALLVSPIAATLRAAEAPGFVEYALLPFNWWLIGGLSLLFLVILRIRTWQLYRPA